VLDGTFVKGQKVSDDQMQQLNLEHHSVCRQWNYTIRPRLTSLSEASPASEGQKVIFQRVLTLDYSSETEVY
jgi:hypothetical protein